MNAKETIMYTCDQCGALAGTRESADACCGPRICDCGKIIESKYWTMCNICIDKADKEKWNKKSLVEYAGEALYYDEKHFENMDELMEYLDDEGIDSAGDLEAEVCDTQILGEMQSAANFADQIEEDLLSNIEDGDPEYMFKDRKELVESIESWLKKQTMQIYTPSGKRVKIPKQEEDEI